IHPTGHIYRAVGEPRHIVAIPSIWDLVTKPEPPLPPAYSAPVLADPWTEALRDPGPVISIAEIKSRVTLHDLLNLPRNGRRHMLRCPLPGHDDENASFAVFADDHFYCFGCQQHGDVLDFVALRDGLT